MKAKVNEANEQIDFQKNIEAGDKEAPVQKPYMIFETGEVVEESGLPGINYDFNYESPSNSAAGRIQGQAHRSQCLPDSLRRTGVRSDGDQQ